MRHRGHSVHFRVLFTSVSLGTLQGRGSKSWWQYCEPHEVKTAENAILPMHDHFVISTATSKAEHVAVPWPHAPLGPFAAMLHAPIIRSRTSSGVQSADAHRGAQQSVGSARG